ncbi:MAG: hypothetical protein H6Q73_3449 [Firmicutes bacterium]|nr:hypothetical protein [Bacillota bacterium]
MAEDIQDQRLKNYLDAEKKALISQEYQEGPVKNRRADLNMINQGINELLSSRVGGRSRRVVLRD